MRPAGSAGYAEAKVVDKHLASHGDNFRLDGAVRDCFVWEDVFVIGMWCVDP